MLFRDIIGQDEIKRRLIESVKHNQIAHAQLFGGGEGIGKYPMALAYARYIQCTNRQEDDACGVCPSCRKYETLMHPDLHFVFPIVKSEKKKRGICEDYIAEWRTFITENSYFNINQWLSFLGVENSQAMIYEKESDEIIRKLSMKTYESEYKVMIIWLPERMNVTCANKLLKIIEEPYDKTVFLLVSDSPDKVLGTILSRSQQINMRPVHIEAISGFLEQKYSISPSDAMAIAGISGGNLVRALESIRLSEDTRQFFDLFVQLMRLAYGRKIKEMKAWADEVAGIGRERQKIFLSYVQRMLRENFIYNLRQPGLNYMNENETAFSSRFAPFIHERNITALMEEFGKAENDIGQNANARIVFFDLSIKMIMLLKS